MTEEKVVYEHTEMIENHKWEWRVIEKRMMYGPGTRYFVQRAMGVPHTRCWTDDGSFRNLENAKTDIAAIMDFQRKFASGEIVAPASMPEPNYIIAKDGSR